MSSESTVTLRGRFVDDISRGIQSVKDTTAALADEFNRAGNGAEEFSKSTSSMTQVFRGFIALESVRYLKDMGEAVFDATAEMQSLKMGMSAVMKSSSLAASEMERLKEVAKLPGLGYSEAIRMSISLQSAGFSADQARESMKAFGNALATVGKGKADLDGVGLALTQIMSKGKVSAEEINQIAERVPQIRIAMQDAFGTANTEMIQAMGLTSSQFIRGVTEELGKLKTVTGGLKNDSENLSDAWFQLKANIGGSGAVFSQALGSVASVIALFNSGYDEMRKKANQSKIDAAMASIAWTKRVVAEEIAAGRVLTAAEKKAIDDKLNSQRAILAQLKSDAGAAASATTDAQKEILKRADAIKAKSRESDLAAEAIKYKIDLRDAGNNAKALEIIEAEHQARLAEIKEKWNKKEKHKKPKEDHSARDAAQREADDINRRAERVQEWNAKTRADQIKQVQDELKITNDGIKAAEKLKEKAQRDTLKHTASLYRLEADEQRKALARQKKQFQDYSKDIRGIADKEATYLITSTDSWADKKKKIQDDLFQEAVSRSVSWVTQSISDMIEEATFRTATAVAQEAEAKAIAAEQIATAELTGAALAQAYVSAAYAASVASFGGAAIAGTTAYTAGLATAQGATIAARETGGSTLGAGGLMVGERRPEYFQPTTPGQIHNSTVNHNFGGVTVNVHGGGGDPQAIAAAVIRAQKIQARGRMATSH